MNLINPNNKKNALVILSGGQDSTTCLFWAKTIYKEVEALSFIYGQRHILELEKAKTICLENKINHKILDISILEQITDNAMMQEIEIQPLNNKTIPNTMVDGRNALFILYAAIYAKSQNIEDIILGVGETDFSGYPDCRDNFIKSMNVSINLAMDYNFKIITPLMNLNKAQTWELADKLGKLEYIKTKTHTCYLGVEGGCGTCPACILRNQGLEEYLKNKNV